jgi:mannosyltransferase
VWREISVAEVVERSQQAQPADPDPRPRRFLPGWLVIAVPAVLAFVTSGFDLGSPSLWRDEAYTKDAINRSLGHLFAMLNHMDAVHGAYYVIVHFFAEVFGTSEAALRFPSLCAMAVATAFTAAIGRRAARMAAPTASGPWPDATGLIAGLVFATAPYMTYYAQMARPYAFVTMCATIASYLLLRAVSAGSSAGAADVGAAAGGRRWWIWYAVAMAFTGLFNTFGLLLIPAHALTVLAIAPGSRSWLRKTAVPWLIAGVAAGAVLIPLLLISFRERVQIAWLTKPDLTTVRILVTNFAGSRLLILPVALLALGGIAAGIVDWRASVSGAGSAAGAADGGPGAADGEVFRMSPAALALPWLVVPPVLLLAVSLEKPVYNARYVEYCLPALALLVAAGLVGLTRLMARTVTSGGLGPLSRDTAAWVPAGLIMLVLAVLLIAPQHAIRQSSARPDNLRLASAIVAKYEQPGDVVFYMPKDMQVLGTGYPAPFEKLRDIALAKSALQSATLTGTELTNPAELASRFTDVRRVWFVTGATNYKFPVPGTPVDREKMTLISGMHILHRWMAGEVMLTLYGY